MQTEKRWHINKIGFFNFWLYQEEEFNFIDGRLLLRGQNGSGKSITTQSIIPFILDGNRNPSRLDPFGSKDRRMEYYFLGDGEKEESTGYLYVEFKKKGEEQYRTVGIGQRAKKNTPMDFWGFVITDGRRIGKELSVYKAVGNQKIPRTKIEMQNALGENPFTTKQKEYKDYVNKYLFGFAQIEEFDRFTDLLIKLRGSKLSKEFNPTKIYDILNTSLQVLSDEDMRNMVEAMERMDNIQLNLDNRLATKKDLDKILFEYNKYNEYMLYKKSKAFLDKKRLADELEKRDITLLNDIKKKEEMLDSNKKALINQRDEKNNLLVKKEAFARWDIETSNQKLQTLKKEMENLDHVIHVLEEKIELTKEGIRKKEATIREQEQSNHKLDETILEDKNQLDELNETVEFSLHKEMVHQLMDKESSEDLTLYKKRIQQLKEEVAQLKNQKLKLEEMSKKIFGKREEIEKANALLTELTVDYQAAERTVDQEKNTLLNGFYEAEKNFVEYLVNEDYLKEMNSIVAYYTLNDSKKIYQRLSDRYSYYQIALNDQKSKVVLEIGAMKKQKEKLEKEFEEIAAEKGAIFHRKAEKLESRELLKNQKILFEPFYEVFDFEDTLNESERNHLEEQIVESGLIDTLVVAKKDYHKTMSLIKSAQDVVICVDQKGKSTFNKLKIVSNHPEIVESAKIVLTHIYQEKIEGAQFVFVKNGAFQNGILQGQVNPAQSASLIGEASRQRKKQALLDEKRKEIDSVEQKIQEYRAEERVIANRLEQLLEEYKNLPTTKDIDTAFIQLEQSNRLVLDQKKELDKLSTEMDKIQGEYKAENRKYLETATLYPYQQNLSTYEEVLEDCAEYEEILDRCNRNKPLLVEKGKSIKVEKGSLEEKIESLDEQLGSQIQKRQEYRKKETEAKTVQEFLNRPDIVEQYIQMKNVLLRLDQIEEEILQLEKQIASSENDILRDREKQQESEISLKNVQKEVRRLEEYFKEELQLKLVFEEENPYDGALKASQIQDSSYLREEVQFIQSRLDEVYTKNSSMLGEYKARMENIFDETGFEGMLRKRMVIVASWRGKKLPILEFSQELEKEIKETQELIRAEDKKLFEVILFDTLSRKTKIYINQSREWVENMSQMMQKMDTSMGLSFALSWKPNKAQGDQIDTVELQSLLTKDHTILSSQDIDKVANHFRGKINATKQRIEERNEGINYMDLVREALDYREWFTFELSYFRNQSGKKALTNSEFNKFSGGEKAMAMYVPLFAAINAQFKKVENPDAPRIVALDEAFAGIDDKNIALLFGMVGSLDFDYIMNSQSLWGCYSSVKELSIIDLIRPKDSPLVTTIKYHWNGKEREMI